MIAKPNLDGRVAFVTGTTRGVGKQYALSLAEAGCDVVSTGKTVEPREDLPGTIHQTAEEVRERGQESLAIQLNVREEDQIREAIEETVDHFGHLDYVINNAGAIQIAPVEEMPAKRFDLMMEVNARAAYLTAREALSHLRDSGGGHIVMSSPPIETDRSPGMTAYGLSKIGMTYVAQSLAGELEGEDIGVNAIWPVTAIDSQATRHFGMGSEEQWRTPEVLADAVLEILSRDPTTCTGNAFYDEEVLREAGVEDFSDYAVVEGSDPPPLSAMMFDEEFDRDEL